MEFYKYQGAGNDFVMIDDRQGIFPQNDTALAALMCDRRYGIGADGLILLGHSDRYDFSMTYYNSDGRKGTMCGNGGRCIAAFARDLGLPSGQNTVFSAVDGIHHAFFEDSNVRLGMNDVEKIERFGHDRFLDTGSPHYVSFVENVSEINVFSAGKKIRNNNYFGPRGGTNVNFASVNGGVINLRTYERGVEDETLACGTGAVATAIAAHDKGLVTAQSVPVEALGGSLRVDFSFAEGRYSKVWLTGPAEMVFKGTWPDM